MTIFNSNVTPSFSILVQKNYNGLDEIHFTSISPDMLEENPIWTNEKTVAITRNIKLKTKDGHTPANN